MIDSKKSNHTEKNNIINKIYQAYRNISTTLVEVFQYKKKDMIMPIPEKIRYLQRFQQGKLTAQDIIDVIHIPGYEMTGIYFACKYLVQLQKFQLGDIDNLISLFTSVDQCASITKTQEFCIGLLQEYTSLQDTIDVHTKLRLQILLGTPVGKLIENNLLKYKSRYTGSTPVIALYAGLQVLPILQKHFMHHEWILVDDKLHEIYVYNNGLRKLNSGEHIIHKNLTIIDDTYWTGNSYKTIKHILSPHIDTSASIQGLFAIEK